MRFNKKLFKPLDKKRVIAKHVPFIKADKLGRICSIYWADAITNVTPPEFKEALNMFRGRQLKTNVIQCLDYIKLVRLKDAGDEEAINELSNLHYEWNNR